MKKIITIIAILIAGILIGKFVLGNNSQKVTNTTSEVKEEHWTCSMHPEIDLPEFGSCPKCGMDLIPKVENADGLSLNEFKMSENALALANIETLVVGDDETESSENSDALKLSGKISANEKATAIQTAHFGGRIEKLKYKSVGEYVKKGSLLATVYSPELVTAQNEFIEALNIKNAQPELYKAVRNKLKNWKISEKQVLKIEQTKKVITNFSMYANVSGYIDEILVQEGSHVNEGMPLFKVSNLNNVWAVFDVYESDIKNLRIGQQLKIRANAFSDKIINSKINFINPNLDVKTRTVQVRATIPNSNSKLKPGMLLTANVAIDNKNADKNNSIEIPKTAVMWTGKRSIIYVKTNKDLPIFELREVVLGSEQEKKYKIISGVENGEEIVVNGTFTVDAAAQLQGKRSMMNKNMVNEKTKNDVDTQNQADNFKRIEVNPKFKKQLELVTQNYIKLKDAFVLTDAEKVSEQAKQALASLKNVKMNLLKKPEAHEVWMPAVKIIKSTLQDISNAKDIEQQRIKFIDLSNAMITVISSFGSDAEIFVEHCPMANDNNGADWLSFEKAIKNPYFGDKMLQCGSVKRSIK